MESKDYLAYLVEEIHTTVVATVDDAGLPVTAAIDMMDADEGGVYFLTARGKGFYDRLKKRGVLALTGMKGEDTMHCAALSIRGKVRELESELLPRLFEKNPYMNEIYPDAASRSALTVFDKAAEIAVRTVQEYKAETGSKIEVIFNVFKEQDERIYSKLLRAD